MSRASRLTDDELEAYAVWAEVERDAPLQALVDELQQRRAGRDRLAIIVLPPGYLSLLATLVQAATPALVVAPEGTQLRALDLRSDCTLESYDPVAMQELRQILAKLRRGHVVARRARAARRSVDADRAWASVLGRRRMSGSAGCRPRHVRAPYTRRARRRQPAPRECRSARLRRTLAALSAGVPGKVWHVRRARARGARDGR